MDINLSDSGELNQSNDRDSNSGGRERERTRDPDNDPPYSRVFVVFPKQTTEEELEPFFKPYGNMQYCRVIKDKGNKPSVKGLAYVKYDKASSAALAIEGLNGKEVDEGQTMKVMIAEAKGTHTSKFQSREPEDNPPRSRLFVICSKEFSEEDLAERFKAFGDLEYSRVIKDKQTNEHKGYAYVKFAKSSTAALAMEHINQSSPESGLKLKALIADPKSKSRSEGGPMPLGGYPPIGMQPMAYSYGGDMGGLPGYPMTPYPMPRQRLFIVCNKSVSQEQLARLFARYSGMEYCDLKRNKVTGESKGFAYVNYSTPQSAMMAKEQMDGFEFPPGYFLKVMFAEPLGVKGGPESSPISAVQDSFAQMMSYPPTMGYSSHTTSGRTAPEGSSSDGSSSKDQIYPEGSRLFIVLSKPLPDYVLQDVFSRYGALEYVRLQKDKNYGYAKYTTATAAQYAIQYLNNTDIHGQKIKIQIANPPSASRKRQRV